MVVYNANMNSDKLPKRRNAANTKASILSAAQEAFTQHGYPQTGIRDIAALADVSSPLLLRYFGSKAGLFEAALSEAMKADAVFSIERSKFGRTMAKVLSNPELEIKPPSMIALSIGDADARDIATEVTRNLSLEPLAAWLGGEHARVRAKQIVILCVGYVLFTRQLPLLSTEELTSADGEENILANWLANAIQAIVDQSGE